MLPPAAPARPLPYVRSVCSDSSSSIPSSRDVESREKPAVPRRRAFARGLIRRAHGLLRLICPRVSSPPLGGAVVRFRLLVAKAATCWSANSAFSRSLLRWRNRKLRSFPSWSVLVIAKELGAPVWAL